MSGNVPPLGSAENPYPVIEEVTSTANSQVWLVLIAVAAVGYYLYTKAS